MRWTVPLFRFKSVRRPTALARFANVYRSGKKARVELVIIRQYGGDGVSWSPPIADANAARSFHCHNGGPERGIPLMMSLLLREDSNYAP